MTYPDNADATSPRPTVSGRYLAKAKLSPFRRARLAALLVNGELDLTRLCANQVAALLKLPVYKVARAVHRGNGNGHKPRLTLVDRIKAASAADLEEVGEKVGIDVVWDRMISPVLTKERTASK
jgi:hypothetical protein